MDLAVIIFWILASLILAAAWAVVNGNDIVHSVVWLATVFLLTACLFILADAEFTNDKKKIRIREIDNIELPENFLSHAILN